MANLLIIFGKTIKVTNQLMKHLAYLNKYLLKYQMQILLGSVFILISNLFALYPAEFVRKALDSVLIYTEQNTTGINIQQILIKYVLLIIAFALLKGLFMFLMRQTIIVMSRKIEFDLKNEIYLKYQELSLSFYNRNKTGDLMNRISEDVSRVRMYLGPGIMYGINISILFYLILTKMISINQTLTIYSLAPLPLLAIIVYFVSNKINKRSEKVQKQLSKLTTAAQENFSGIRVIKSFSNHEDIFNKFYQECKIYKNKQLNLVKIEAFFFPTILFLIGISTISIIYAGGIQVNAGKITPGNIAEFIIYVNMLAWPIASIGWVTSIIQRAAASQERINFFLKTKNEIVKLDSKEKFENGDIKFKKVSFKYHNNDNYSVKNLNFEIKKGKTLGIFGKTGSGKSTIANLICRLYDVGQGDILIANKSIKKINVDKLRQCISYVPQDGYLFSGSIEENIGFSSNNICQNKIKKAAKEAAIHEEIMNFNDCYSTVIGERGVKLSGGQKQRLAISRALYKTCDILIFDDCLSAVDAIKEKEIINNIKNKSKNKTTIIISHRIATIKEADQIIVLDNGEIIEQGTHSELTNNKGYYFQTCESQTRELKS